MKRKKGTTKKGFERKFRREMRLKNEAYSFILEFGLTDAFYYFCKLHQGEDHHKACIRILTEYLNRTGFRMSD